MVMRDDDIFMASSPAPRHASTIPHFGPTVRSFWLRSLGNVMSRSTVAGTTVLRRDLSDGAIAGTVVGVSVAAAFVAFCLYPVVVHQIKRRNRVARPLDAEAGTQAQRIKTSTLDPNSHRRLPSTDSFKHNRQLSRGKLGAGTQSKELGCISGGSEQIETERNLGSTRQLATATGGNAWQPDEAASHAGALDDDYRNESTPFPYYMPASMPDDKPGVLKGTSHDYYSPSIPSSAFGMVTAADSIEPVRTLSRGSSFIYSLKQILGRPSGRDSSLASVLSTENKAASARSPGTDLGRVCTSRHFPTDSPTKFSPTSTSRQEHLANVSPSSPAANYACVFPKQFVITTPAYSSPPQRAAFKASPSPPSDSASGTVNPMDVMPASTQSELWHRAEHQLLTASWGPPPGPSFGGDQVNQEDVSTFLPPTASAPSAAEEAQVAQFSTPAYQEALQEALNGEDHSVTRADLHSHGYLSPSMIPERSRHPSYPSDHSTPFPGAHSTGPSTENTPSTQLDSPSPGSMNSPDFRHSTSPQPLLASPKVGAFRCGEPGCSQTFEQPHKLKHHQRYHSKDHKCPFKNCGKGFGTKTHLQRHINDRHEKRKKFHCAIPGCDYSKSGGKAFPRKDNWKRHMTKIHSVDQQQLPEPVEIESEMGGA